MKRRERIERWANETFPSDTNMGVEYGDISAELRALWAVYDEYADAIEQLGGTLPPALDAYDRGDDGR